MEQAALTTLEEAISEHAAASQQLIVLMSGCFSPKTRTATGEFLVCSIRLYYNFCNEIYVMQEKKEAYVKLF